MSGAMSRQRNWYLVHCKPRQERVAEGHLARQGYEVYLPLFRQARRRQGRRVSTVGPMFPRYLFIHLDSRTDNWGPIRSTRGVSALVRFGQEPARVPDGLISFLRGREDEKGIQTVQIEEFRAGGRVRVTEGPFAGYEGVYVARSGKERVVVLLSILGQETRTQIESMVLEPISGK